MLNQINVEQSYQASIVPANTNRLIKVIGLNEYDLENIQDVIEDQYVDKVRNDGSFHNILMRVVLQGGDQMSVDDIIADLNALYGGIEDTLELLAINELEDLYEADQVYDDPIRQAVQFGLGIMDVMELICAEFVNHQELAAQGRGLDGIVASKIMIAGKVLRAVVYGTDRVVTLS